MIERSYTGTAFVAGEAGLLVTNRHVALPWEFDEVAAQIASQGLVPFHHRFAGYLPGVREAFDVELVAASPDADVALLRCSGVTGRVKPLELGARSSLPGEEVIVLGYPTGMQALLARVDERVLAELLDDPGRIDFWEVARRLAERGLIAPLATRGIVGQVSEAHVVYDALTSGGGSGGPVLDLEGRVVAVNAATLAEFGGSNLGVPAAAVVALLERPAE